MGDLQIIGDPHIIKAGDRKRVKSSRKPDKQNVRVPDDESRNLGHMSLSFLAIASVIGGFIILATLRRNDTLTDCCFAAAVFQQDGQRFVAVLNHMRLNQVAQLRKWS
jgi:hypothetical protein